MYVIRFFSGNAVLREILAIVGQQKEQLNEILKRTDVLNPKIDSVVASISRLTLSSAGNVVFGGPVLPVAFEKFPLSNAADFAEFELQLKDDATVKSFVMLYIY